MTDTSDRFTVPANAVGKRGCTVFCVENLPLKQIFESSSSSVIIIIIIILVIPRDHMLPRVKNNNSSNKHICIVP